MRKRLLFGSLAVAAVVSVPVGLAIAHRSNGNTATDAVTLTSGGAFDSPIVTNAVVRGKQLPSVDIDTLDGAVFNTAALLGQPLVINVWTSTCIPCRKELPAFAKLQTEKGNLVRFVGVDTLGPSQREEDFARKLGVGYELFYDGDGAFLTALGITSLPVTLFVNRDGTIVRQTGEVSNEQLRAYVAELS